MKSWSIFLVYGFFLFSYYTSFAQCNVSASVCQTGVSQPFPFLNTSGAYAGGSFANAGCATGAGGQHIYGFITMNITTSGPLNLLINGNANSGFVDVAVFNIPPGVSPCVAVLNPANAIGCNFASQSGGCVQFGNAFNCGSSVPAPNVVAGQEIMIVAQSWSAGTSTSFTLQLGPPPGAQSGPPNASINPAGPFCTSDSPVQLQAANLGGTWSGPGVSPSGMFNPALAGPGTHTINYSIGVSPCIDQGQTTITVNPLATVQAEIVGHGSSVTICQGESVTLQASGVSTYNWNQGLGAGATHTVSPNSTTTYTVTGTNDEGCTHTASVTVNISPTPVVTASQDQTICINGTTTISATATGGANFDYHWNHTADNGASQVVTPTDQSTTYSVYVTNQFGCESLPDEVVVSWYPPLSAVISPNDTVCPTQSGTLFVSNITGGNGGPYNVEWYDAVGNLLATGNVLNHVIYSSGVYTAVITDNCTTPQLVLTSSIIAGEVPGVSFMVNESEQCQPGVFTYTNLTDPAASAELYWQFGNGITYQNLNSVTFEEDLPGSYYAQLIVVSEEGCRDTLRLNNHFTVHENPIAKFIWTPFNPKVSYPEANFFDNSYRGDYYSWTFDQGNPAMSNEQNPVVMFPNDKANEYLVTLTVTTEFGCTDSIANLIKIVPDIVLYVPNAFTPDGDKFNETWRVYIDGIDIYNFDLFIYNRWGEIVWESHNPEAEWDGTYGGMPVPEGAYIWTIKCADFTTDEKFEFKGHFTVLR